MSKQSSAHPFSRLTPNWILDAVEHAGQRPDGRLSALNSYENRVWQVGLDSGESVVVKFYRPGRWSEAQLREEHEFLGEMRVAELPVVAPLALNEQGDTLATFSGFHFALFPRQGGRAPELDQPEVLEWMGRLMARIHTVGARRPFALRETLDLHAFGIAPRDWLHEHGSVPAPLRAVWRSVVDQALDGVARCYQRAGSVRYIRLHGDCHGGNVLWTPGQGPHFVDFDDARMGPAVQDLWMLLSGEAEEMAVQLRYVLRGYETMRDFDYSELPLIEGLRTLRLLHHCAWLARRWDDPAFPAAFPWFSMPRYWEESMQNLREQCTRMAEPMQTM